MALTMGPNTGLVENGAPGEGHYAELMRKWRWEDFLAQPVVKSRVTALPTSGQANGDTYLYVGSGGNANKLARWTTRTTTAQWEYLTAKLGWRVQVADELDTGDQVKTYEFDGSAWVEKVGGGGGGSGLPAGGIEGDLLVKQSGASGDASWRGTLPSLKLDTQVDYTPPQEGAMVWNAESGTADLGLNGGSAVLQIGQETLYRVENATGSTIPNGTLCMYAGTVGASGKMRVAPWDGSGPSQTIMGLATEDILDGEQGYLTAFGKVRGIDTTGTPYGETWLPGEILWAGATGGLTNVEPTAPGPRTRVAVVINTHVTAGTLFVRPTYGSSLADDELVQIGSMSDGDVLTWVESEGRFTPMPPTGGSGGSGTVHSVGLSVPSGFTVAGSPVTSSGTIAIAFAAGYSLVSAADRSAWSGKLPTSGGILLDAEITRYRETINAAAGATLDRSTGGIQRLELTANTALDLTDLTAGQSVMYRVTGGTTYTLSYTGLGAWSNGTMPTLAATHYLEFVHDGVEVVGFDCGGR